MFKTRIWQLHHKAGLVDVPEIDKQIFHQINVLIHVNLLLKFCFQTTTQ